MPEPISWAYAGPYYLAALAAGYLLGSIPFGLLLTKVAGLGDIRKVGSGNIGATNVLRTGRKDLAALTLVLDAAKGGVVALVAGWLYGPDIAVVAAFGAFLGHLFPIWLRFKGGKGMATFLGIFLALAWPIGLMACAIWLIVAALFRYSSLAGLLAAIGTPVLLWILADPRFAWSLADPQKAQLGAAMALLVVIRHQANIRRLLKGEEPRIGARKSG